MTGTAPPSPQLARVWKQQRIWSQAANHLRKSIDRARFASLLLAIATAAFAVAADQVGGLSDGAGQALGAAAAITAGLATLIQRRIGTDTIRNWIRARSASEGLTTEVYSYLGRGTAYAGPDCDQHLGTEARRIVDAVEDLQLHTMGIEPDDKPVPQIHDTASYINERVNDQIHNFYRQKAPVFERRARRLRNLGDLLGLIAVALAALAAALKIDGLAAWVPVVTTIGTALAAHTAAARYDHLVIEYLRTAQRLEHIRDQHLDTPADAVDFIDACEAAISVENQAWMARWNHPVTPSQ
jgi:hypothetical protein